MFNQKNGSRRWQHFHSALQLAVQRASHKWTYEDFKECFPLYVEEDKNGSTTFNSIGEYIESECLRDLEKLFEDYNVQENIDTLHRIVNEAKDRKANGEARNDVWREGLEPRVATCARTVPLLEAEAARLRQTLATMQARTSRVQAELEETVKATEDADARTNELLDQLDIVLESWKNIPTDKIEAWTVQTLEASQPNQPG
ncbi:hypothetical protein Moror_14141 [Moniliophthora roreri MCA 2997]|uniref:Nnf1-domain-containing protein n=2 Tax=Moniliophthora roreri TaxID=221103 RepID=V2X6S4_MONRO|nr:hypothetical protein Moror_14141 [Moniliophthora roreri MCA 2997]